VRDKFYVAKRLNEAVDRVRRAENRQLHSEGSDLLGGTKYVWLKNPDNWHETDQLKLTPCVPVDARSQSLADQVVGGSSQRRRPNAQSPSWQPADLFTHAISNTMTEGFNSNQKLEICRPQFSYIR
jgi:transposase